MLTRRLRRWSLILLCGATAIAAAIAVALAIRVPDPQALLREQARPSILITDRSGRLLYEAMEQTGNKYVPLPLAEIPTACRQATIATEDSRFYSHPGVDVIAIARALRQNLLAGTTVSGGSTLTQQLARNIYMTEAERQERTLGRKLREAWLALRLELRYSKDELLAIYLNTTYYGHYARGIEAASQAYFGIHASELSLAQCALLAGLPQYPAGYDPTQNLDAAKERQATVLALMVAQGDIDADAARLAGREGLKLASTPFPISAPHFVMWVQGQLESMMPERAAAGGLRVTTTLDLDWQRVAEGAVGRRLAELRPCASGVDATPGAGCDPGADPSRRVENAALIALDPKTGEVLALVGSPDYFDATIGGAVNAGLALRQPGSAIKPITYVAALDPGRAAEAGRSPWTAATLIGDIRSSFTTAEGTAYTPNNYDRRYHGPVTVRTALANSYNIPAVKALEFVGVDALVNQAGALGIPWDQSSKWRPVESGDEGEALPRYGLALTLGGGEVRLLELVAAYGAFANGGVAVVPYAIQRVETLDGEVLHEAGTPAARQALDPRAAFVITDILSDAAAREPAFGRHSTLDIGRPAAAKTGTTTDWRDNWTVGYTPQLVAGVWVGNADNSPMKDVSGISGAAPIWRDFMVTVLRDTAAENFARPAGLRQLEVCADSGLPPLEARPPHDEAVSVSVRATPCPTRRLEWFIEGTEPRGPDDSHIEVVLDAATGRLATEATPPERRQTEVFWVLGPEYQSWARENNFRQPPPEYVAMALRSDLPSQAARHSEATSVALAGALPAGQLRIVSPDPNRRYRIDPGLPGSAQQIPLSAIAGGAGTVQFLVDGMPYASVEGPDYTVWWTLAKGRHVVEARSAPGRDGPAQAAQAVIFVE